MLVRKIFKLAYPCVSKLASTISAHQDFPNFMFYTPHYNFSQSTTKSKSQFEEQGDKKYSNFVSSTSESDSELSSEEEKTADLNAINPLAKKSIEDIYKENELVPTEPLKIISKEGDSYPMIKTIYGRIVSANSFLNRKILNNCKTVHYVNDQSSVKHIIGLLKDPKCIVVFDPTTHYANMFATYNGVKRRILKDIYGTAKSPKNPFQKCKTNKEIFDLHRRILIQQKHILARICLFVDYEGSIRIKGDQKSSIPTSLTLKAILEQVSKSGEEGSYFKNDFIVPVSYWLGLNSSDEWEKKGISIDVLGGAKIYPHYSVWAPTSQHYLSIFDEYIEKKKSFLKSRKNTLDIGCGTGVLSLILNKKCEGIKDIYAVDSNKKAVECAKINSQIFDASEITRIEQLDFVDAVNTNKIDTFLTEKK